jgi:WD40 repeat protein
LNSGTVDAGLFLPTAFPPEKEWLVALNPRGTRLAVSCTDRDEVQVFDPGSGREVTRCTGFFRVFGIGFLSADVLLVTAFHGCFRCHLRRGEREVLSPEGWLTRTTVSPNGRVLAIGRHGGLDLYDVRSRRVVRRLATNYTYNHWGRRAAFSAGGRYLAAELGNEADREPTLVVVWDARTGKRQRLFDTEAHALAFRGDTLALAVADDHPRILLYEPDQGETPAKELTVGHTGCELQFRDGGRTLAALLGNGEFVQFQVKTGRVLRRIPPPAHPQPMWRCVASADWSRFAGITEGGLVVWPGDRARPGAAGGRVRRGKRG